jgi:hypothetical protein
MRQILAAVLAAFMLTAGAGLAGIVDSPIPAAFRKHAHSVSGVQNRAELATFF